MDKKIERKIIWTLAIILIVIGLFGCTTINKKIMIGPVQEKILITDSIANMGSIADALGCMFAGVCKKEESSSALVDDKINP